MNNEPQRRHLHALPDPRSKERFETVRSIDDAPTLPKSVHAEMAHAAELWESLRQEGKQLRYEVDAESGRVSVELRGLDGAHLRAVPLAEALGAAGDDAPAA